jgi:putative ABC transport system permease protein
MSYKLVQQRTEEIVVRMALGASTSSVLRMVVRQGMVPVLVGLSLAGAFALTRAMESLLYNVSAVDPWRYMLVTIFLILIALMACYFPATKAMRIDPMIALRSE